MGFHFQIRPEIKAVLNPGVKKARVKAEKPPKSLLTRAKKKLTTPEPSLGLKHPPAQIPLKQLINPPVLVCVTD